jgi:8-oxo-dGTP pyrophosphatase MutT (NUDIX family)
MDSRRLLLATLASHRAEDEKEATDLANMRRYAETLGDPLSPAELPAHFTASAIVVDTARDHVCMVHHKKLERWLQPGGHVEAADHGKLELTALREVREETGLDVVLYALAPAPLDVDIHVIPARGPAAEHEHLDVRFLALATTSTTTVDPNESLGVRWFTWEEAREKASDPALVRMLAKAERHCRSQGGTPQISVPLR